jgi:hypothetical protein
MNIVLECGGSVEIHQRHKYKHGQTNTNMQQAINGFSDIGPWRLQTKGLRMDGKHT